MSTTDIKYRYAVDKNDLLVDVFDLDRAFVPGGTTYQCLSCNSSLVPKLGTKKIKHFAHMVDTACNQETYLHRLWKLKFHEIYQDCLGCSKPFWVTMRCTTMCKHYRLTRCWRVYPRKYNLTEVFDTVVSIDEKMHGGFKADVLLGSTKHDVMLFVEFAYTHKSEENKIKSGTRIIEYIVDNDNDIDKKIRDCRESENVRFYNFKTENLKYNCAGNCPEHINPNNDKLLYWPLIMQLSYINGKLQSIESDPGNLRIIDRSNYNKYGPGADST